MAAICYHRWHAQLYLYLGPALEMVDVPLFRDFFLMISEQPKLFIKMRNRKALPPKQHLDETHRL